MACIGTHCSENLSFSLGIYAGIGRLGAILCFIIIPFTFNKTGVTHYAYWIAFVFSILTFISCLILYYIEKQHTKKLTKHNQNVFLKTLSKKSNKNVNISKGILNMPEIFWFMIFLVALLYAAKNTFAQISSGLIQTRFKFDRQTTGIIIVFSMFIIK